MDVDVTAPVCALFGLDGFRLLAAADAGGELELMVETTADLVPCPECGAVARAKDRRPTWVRDLPLGDRPVVICWVKRIWSCVHALCPARTWTEQHEVIGPRECLTRRARAWAVGEVGDRDGVVSRTAAALGVGWHTVMRHVVADGTPKIDHVLLGAVTRLRMALAPRRSDAVDVLAADGPGVDDQRPRDPL